MNTSGLYKGQKFSSYKALCAFIGEEPKNNKIKKERHYEHLKNYFDFKHISTQKIEITKVHLSGDFSSNNILRNNNSNALARIILYHLQQNKGELMVTWSELFEKTGSMSKSYNHFNVVDALSSKYGEDNRKQISIIDTFCYERVWRLHYNLLKELEKKKIIYLESMLLIVKESGEFYVADDYEKAAVYNAEKKALRHMKLFTYYEVIRTDRLSEFYELVNGYLSNLEITSYIKGYFIKIRKRAEVEIITKNGYDISLKKYQSVLPEKLKQTLITKYENPQNNFSIDFNLFCKITDDVISLVKGLK